MCAVSSRDRSALGENTNNKSLDYIFIRFSDVALLDSFSVKTLVFLILFYYFNAVLAHAVNKVNPFWFMCHYVF